jgi:hypothetical protein
MYDGNDTIVLFEKIAYEDLLPVRWVPHPKAVDDVTARHMAERNVRVLQACDALEEYGQHDKPDDESPHSADLMRLDFKLIRLNSLGATWKTDETPLTPGDHGILEVGIRDIVVQPLNLPAEAVASATPGEARVRFTLLGEVVADHIEKLVFRRHRRKIADTRRPRRA